MGVCGIITEYNPFHLGHIYQLSETRNILGENSFIVCVMSGNYVQRGECAIVDKWSRTRAALQGGADLVLELPTPWATASAEAFARGAVEILAATGVVDQISFGSEAGTMDDLYSAARCMDTAAYQEALHQELGRGLSFATAREEAVRSLVGSGADCLATPNNNLAVEYLRALPANISAMTVKRVGVSHDGGTAEGFASASALRKLLQNGDVAGARAYLPPGMAAELERAIGAGIAPASLDYAQRAILARLRTMTEGEFASLPDSGAAEGLPARLVKAAAQACTLEEFYQIAKTKRYAHARLRRLALWAFLGLRAEHRTPHLPYIRVLGLNGRGQELLARMKKTCTLPVITKPAHARKLTGEGLELFCRESGYTDLYALCTPKTQPCGLEWTTGPVVI